MRHYKKIAVLAVMMLIAFSSFCCGKKYTIVGTWTDDSATFVFKDDKTGSLSLNDGAIEMEISEYSVEDDKLTLKIVLGSANITEKEIYTFSLNKDELKLKQSTGYEYNLKRKK